MSLVDRFKAAISSVEVPTLADLKARNDAREAAQSTGDVGPGATTEAEFKAKQAMPKETRSAQEIEDAEKRRRAVARSAWLLAGPQPRPQEHEQEKVTFMQALLGKKL